MSAALEGRAVHGGYWIGHSWSSEIAGGINKYYAFRRKLFFPAEAVRAEIKITADARYSLWINGKLVNKGPLRCYPEQQSFDRLDVSSYLKKGDNWIAVIVHQFGVSVHHHYVHRMRTGLMIQGEAELATGECHGFGTDPSWSVRKACWYEETQARVSAVLGFQERYCAPKEPAGWKTGEDGETGWERAFFLGPVGIWPWVQLVERDIPYLQESLTEGQLVYTGSSSNKLGIHAKDNLLHLLREECIERQSLQQRDAEGWMTIELPGSVQRSQVIAFDYNVIAAGYALIEVQEAAGSSIIIDHYYSVESDENCPPRPIQGFGGENEGAVNRLTVTDSAGSRMQNLLWESYLPLGYRYHTLMIRGEGTIKLRVAKKTVHYPVTLTGQFQTNDDTLNRIWATSENTLRYGMLDIYADNVWREQGNWLHDMVAASRSALSFYGDTSLARRSLLQFTSQVLPDGSIYSVGPADFGYMALSDYCFVWVDGVRWYYEQTGDGPFLQQCLPVVEGILHWAKTHCTADGLFLTPETHWHFIDWSELEKKPCTLTIQLLLLQAVENAHWLAGHCEWGGRTDYAQWACQLREIIESKFWDPEANAWKEHIEPSALVKSSIQQRKQPLGWPVPEKYKETAAHSIHANSLAVLLRLGDSRQRQLALAYLKDMDNKLPFHKVSPLWIDKYMSALFEAGLSCHAMALVKQHYLEALNKGLTTWPEIWGDSDLSYESTFGGQTCGASIAWVLTKYVLGVSPVSAGWAHIRFEPALGDLEWVKGEIPTPLGTISVCCEKEGTNIAATVTVPEGMRITSSGQKQSESGKRITWIFAQ